MRNAASVIRALGTGGRDAPVSAAEVGLVFDVGMPPAVVVAMILWPSDYDDRWTVSGCVRGSRGRRGRRWVG
jgi:hypothetical protein